MATGAQIPEGATTFVISPVVVDEATPPYSCCWTKMFPTRTKGAAVCELALSLFVELGLLVCNRYFCAKQKEKIEDRKLLV